MLNDYVAYYPILISNLTWSIKSSGGIDLKFNITNCTQNTIKYVYVTGYCLNAVEDRCHDEISGKTTWTVRCIGPIEPCPTSINNFYEREKSCVGSYHFENPIFYSHVARSIVFSSISIEYMDGKKTTLSEEILKKHRIR